MNTARSSRRRYASVSRRRQSNYGNFRSWRRKRRGDPRRRVSPSPSPERRSPSPKRERRSPSNRSSSRERDSGRDRRIRDLERDVRDADEKARSYRTMVLNLEHRLHDVESAKAESESTSERLRVELAKENSKKKDDVLRMQVETQAILLRQFQEANAKLEDENMILKKRGGGHGEIGDGQSEMIKGHLNSVMGRVGRIKSDWASLREDIRSQLCSFNEEFEEVQGHVFSILDVGFGSYDPDRAALRMEGKLLVEERNLRDLLETIMWHTRAVAQDCNDAVRGNIKKWTIDQSTK